MEQVHQTQDLHIKATRLFPGVHFKADGNLKIIGRIISDNLCAFFCPLFEWVENCTCEKIHLMIDLDYLNSNGTFLLVELLKRLENRSNISSVEVVWQYEEEDEEHFELGEIIREKLSRSKFKYLMYV